MGMADGHLVYPWDQLADFPVIIPQIIKPKVVVYQCFSRLCCLFSLVALSSGCSWVRPDFATVDSYDYGVGLREPRPIDSFPVTILVKDLRPSILSLKKTPTYVGRAENGWGEARDVLNRDNCAAPVSVHRTSHCRSLAESIQNRLKSTTTFVPPENANGLLLIKIWQWETRAAADLKLDYALEVYLRSSTGERLGSATLSGEGELIDIQNIGVMTWSNHEAKEQDLSRLVSGKLEAKLDQLLKGQIMEALERLR